MKKWGFIALTGIISYQLLGSIAIAQSFFNAPPTTTQAKSPILSNEEFASKAKSLSQQTKSAIAQEAKDSYSKSPTTPSNSLMAPTTASAPPTPETSIFNTPSNQGNAASATSPSKENRFPTTTNTAPNSNSNAPAAGGGWNIKY